MKKVALKILVLCMVVCSTLFVFTACGESPISFKLSFVVDGEVVKTIDTTGNEKISLPNDPQKDNYTFDGWFWDKDVWEKPFTANSLSDAPLSSDMSVYAKFKPNHEHEYAWEITKQPTCTEKGVRTGTCSCGDTQTEEIDALGHTPSAAVEENRIDATYTENGSYDSVVYCSACGEEISREQKTIGKLGHNYESKVTNPTCTEQGYTTHTCTSCDDSR